MEAIKLCRLDTPIIFIEARINLSRFVVTGCAAKTSARSEERFSRNAETDLVCRLLLEKKKRDVLDGVVLRVACEETHLRVHGGEYSERGIQLTCLGAA